MEKYCLSFDIIDTKKWDTKSLKKKLVKLLRSKGAFISSNPLTNTILFEDSANNARINYWNNVLITAFHEEIFYYICLIDGSGEDEFTERNISDGAMESEFQTMLDTI